MSEAVSSIAAFASSQTIITILHSQHVYNYVCVTLTPSSGSVATAKWMDVETKINMKTLWGCND